MANQNRTDVWKMLSRNIAFQVFSKSYDSGRNDDKQEFSISTLLKNQMIVNCDQFVKRFNYSLEINSCYLWNMYYLWLCFWSTLGLWNCVKFTYSQKAIKFYLTLFGKFEKSMEIFYAACCCLLRLDKQHLISSYIYVASFGQTTIIRFLDMKKSIMKACILLCILLHLSSTFQASQFTLMTSV